MTLQETEDKSILDGESLTQEEIDYLASWEKSIQRQSRRTWWIAMEVIEWSIKWWILPDTLEWAIVMADELDWRRGKTTWATKIELAVDLNPHLEKHLREEHGQKELWQTDVNISEWEGLSPEVVAYLESLNNPLSEEEIREALIRT
jgi:hypothetical protein